MFSITDTMKKWNARIKTCWATQSIGDQIGLLSSCGAHHESAVALVRRHSERSCVDWYFERALQMRLRLGTADLLNVTIFKYKQRMVPKGQETGIGDIKFVDKLTMKCGHLRGLNAIYRLVICDVTVAGNA